jgi:hypothetical protein
MPKNPTQKAQEIKLKKPKRSLKSQTRQSSKIQAENSKFEKPKPKSPAQKIRFKKPLPKSQKNDPHNLRKNTIIKP